MERAGSERAAEAGPPPATAPAADPTRLATPPAVFNFELTNRCPFRCVMCARTNNMTRAQGLMDFDLFRTTVDAYVALNPGRAATEVLWLHHFGESLLHPDFARFVAHASDRGVRTGLSVNPLMLKEPTARALLAARPALLYLSLDGHDDASFERIRGVKDAYEDSKRNLLAFLDLKVRTGAETEIVVSMIRFGPNAESIARTKDFWASVPGVDHVWAKDFVTWDGNAPDVTALRHWTPKPPKDHVTCRFPWESVTVTWDGDVVPCCYDYDKRLVLGNLGRQSLAEIWNGEPLRRLRREFLDGRVENPLCRNCEHLRA